MLVGSRANAEAATWSSDDLRAAVDRYRQALAGAGVADEKLVEIAERFVSFLETGSIGPGA